MYVEKLKNGKYRCQLSYKDPVTKKHKKISMVVPDNKKATLKAAERMLEEKADILPVTEYTLFKLSKLFLNYTKQQVGEKTLFDYTANINAMFKHFIDKDIYLHELTTKYINGLIATKTYKRPSIINKHLRTLRLILKYAYNNEFLEDENLIKRIRFMKTPKRDISGKYLELNELKKIVNKSKFNDFYVFLALTGMRTGEALALTVDDINIKDRYIRINKNYSYSIKKITPTKTNSSTRNIYIQNELLVHIKKIIVNNKQKCLEKGIRTDLLFFNDDGDYLYQHVLNKYFKRLVKEELGKDLTLHSLRHTHTSLMFESGLSLDALSKRLGHINSIVTQQIYLHLTEKFKNEVNEKLDSIEFFKEV